MSPSKPLGAEPTPERPPLRVLLIEDSELDAELIVRELRRGGYEVEWERVDSAAGLSTALQRPWDAITCDWVMPGFGAPQALRMIAEAGVDVPTIIVSGEVGEEFAVTAMKGGAHDFVSKHRLARLVPAVERERREAEGRRARRRAEAALVATERRFRTIIETALDTIAILDGQGVYRYLSPAIEVLTGFAPEELIGANAFDLVHPDDRSAVASRLAEGLAQRVDSGVAEYRLRHRDGSWRVVEAVARNLLDDPAVAGVVIHVRDVTARRQMESALQLQSAIMANITDGVALSRATDGTIVHVNPACEALFGYAPGGLQGQDVERLCAEPAPGAASLDDIRRAVRAAGSWRGEVRTRRRDGGAFWCSVAVSKFEQDELGEVWVWDYTDITAQKTADAALRRSEEHMRLALGAAPMGTWEWDTATDRYQWSGALCARMGFQDAAQLTMKEFAALLHPQDRRRVHRDHKAALQDDAPYEHEVRLVAPDGLTRWALVHGRVLRDAAGRPERMVGIDLDITERKRAEAALAQEREFLATLIRAVPDLVWLKDPHGTYLACNEAFEHFIGRTGAEIVGRTDAELAPPAELASFLRRKDDTTLTRGTASTTEEWVRFVDGRRVRLQTIKTPLRAASGALLGVLGVARDVTAMREAEDTLRQRLALQEQLETIAAVSPDVIYTAQLRVDGTICFPYASPAFADIAGLRPEDIRDDGSAIFALVHPDDLERINTATATSARTLQPWRCEFRLRNPQRGERWVSGHSIPQRAADGSVLWHGVLRDVTDRHRAEAALRASETRYRSLFRNMLNGFALCRMEFEDGQPRDFVYLEVNDAFGALTGLRDVVGRRASEVIPGLREANPELFAIYGGVVTSGRSTRFETFLPALGVWLDIAVYDAGDGCFVAVFENSTERREGEQMLRASEERLRVTMDTMLEGLQVIGEDWRYRYVNPAAAAQGRRAPAELIGRTMMECYPGIERTRVFAALQRCMTAHTSQHLINEFAFPDGSTGWFQLSVQRVPEGIAILSVDVTDRQRAEAELRQLTADLEARVTQRTAELDAANRDLQSFTYSVSHDLRAPLRSIDGFSQAVLEDHGALLPEEGQRQLEAIRRGARRMGQLIEALLQLSRLGRAPLRVGPVDMALLAREVLDELAPMYAGRDVSVRVGELPACEGDATLLKQVWANLLGNAFKYTSRRAAAVIELGARTEAGGVVYFVRDNGAGFDMTAAGRLFNVFQRLHGEQEFEGTGVGLAIVRQIVQRHGGRVWAEGAVDRGATFFVTLGSGGDARPSTGDP